MSVRNVNYIFFLPVKNIIIPLCKVSNFCVCTLYVSLYNNFKHKLLPTAIVYTWHGNNVMMGETKMIHTTNSWARAGLYYSINLIKKCHRDVTDQLK